MTAYYNEFDKTAAQWLRNLIAAGHIAPGDVDDRSIEDVQPDDLRGYAQCHFFAGVGVWSHALRSAGWSDDRQIWTGSCPCQPFSAAGKGAGFDDERHLWPAFNHLIEQCRPAMVLGEQVASKAVDPWIDLVQDDLEALGYRVGAVPFPSASVGAPHIRDRTYWVGSLVHPVSSGLEGLSWDGNNGGEPGRVDAQSTGPAGAPSVPSGVADAEQRSGGREAEPTDHRQPQTDGPADRFGGRGGSLGWLDSAIRYGRGAGRDDDTGHDGQQPDAAGNPGRPGPTNGFWSDADWLYCRDGRWRPVEPGTFPLAHGAAARVGRLRAYGNAINAKAAQAFIEVVMEIAKQ